MRNRTDTGDEGDEIARICRLLWAASALFTLYASTLPFQFVGDAAVIQEHVVQALQRSAISSHAHLSRPDILQNVLLFVPIGFVGIGAAARRRSAWSLALSLGAA